MASFYGRANGEGGNDLKRLTKRNLVIGLTFLFVLASCTLAFAATPAFTMKAPLPQAVGIADKPYSDYTETDCRVCHGSNTADLHHMTPTALDTTDPTKGCVACHTLTAQGTIATPINRNCFGCHPTSWHHTTQAAQAGTCTACHDPAILAEQGAGLVPPEAPTYTASEVTPQPIDCANCHNDFNPDWNPETQSGTPNTADPNSISHHGAMNTCGFCHDAVGDPITGGVAIRMCESCHTITTLHTITAHTDSNDKCVGCHGTYIASLPPVNSPIAASVSGLDKTSAKPFDYVVISGANFGTIADQASVVLTKTDALGNVINKFAPISSLTEDSIRAMIPSDAEAGNYSIYVRVGGKNTNNTAFTVVNAPYITPGIGKSGDVLSIKGNNLTVGMTTLAVRFVQGSYVSVVTPTVASGSLQVTVPAGMVAGKYLVSVTNDIGVSNTVTFTIGAAPKINSVLPGSAAVGKTTVIYGSNLSLGTKPTVKFGTVSAVVKTYSATKVYVTVPAMAAGATQITLNNGFGDSNAIKFTVK